MIDLQVLKENPDLAKSVKFEMSGSDLLTVTDEYARRAVEAEKAKETPAAEKYLTPQQYADALQVSLVTLWSWDKKGITHPLYIGNAKRYRQSDLEKMSQEE